MLRCIHQRRAVTQLQNATCRNSILCSSWKPRRVSASRCSWQCHSRTALVCRASTSGSSPPTISAHDTTFNQQQAEAFSQPQVVNIFTQKAPEDIQQRLRAIVGAIPNLSATSRVIDVGSGTGCLIPHYQARGVQDILAVDLSEAMLEQLRAIHAPHVTHLGNQLGVRTWCGDVVDLPNYLGWAADAFVFNSVFGNLHTPRTALLKACLQLKPGGHIVVSHPLGRAWHQGLAAEQPTITPHLLPDRQALDALIQGLPLQVVEFRDEPELYLAVMQVPPRYEFPSAPVSMHAPVVHGFGRGSRHLGTPTANLDPARVQDALPKLQQGVYFGWARLAPTSGDWPEPDLRVHKMVMNVGRRPTVNTGDEGPTVEVHVLHEYSQDFHGQEMHAVALGFIRPEIKFTGGLPELLGRIKLDVSIGKNQLDDPACSAFQELVM